MSLAGGHVCSFPLHGAGCRGCSGCCRGYGRGFLAPPSKPRAGDSPESHAALSLGVGTASVAPALVSHILPWGSRCRATLPGGCPSWGRAQGAGTHVGLHPHHRAPSPATEPAAPRAAQPHTRVPWRNPGTWNGISHSARARSCRLQGRHEFGSSQEVSPAAASSPDPSLCRAAGTQPQCPQGWQVPPVCWEGTGLHPSVTGGHSR